MNNIKFVTDIDCVVNDWVGGFSPLEQKFILKYCKKPVLHLFSGSSEIGEIRVDINPESKATIIDDVFTYISSNSLEVNTILLDPIYCTEQRTEIWREKYAKKIKKEVLYIYPYDTRRTKKLYEFFTTQSPYRIIIKAPDRHIPEGYELLAGLNVEVGAFKPNRNIWVYQRKNHKLEEFI